jgi:hypothetical protein
MGVNCGWEIFHHAVRHVAASDERELSASAFLDCVRLPVNTAIQKFAFRESLLPSDIRRF